MNWVTQQNIKIMNRADSKKIAETITNEQLKDMFEKAKSSISDWTKVSNVNKGMTKDISLLK